MKDVMSYQVYIRFVDIFTLCVHYPSHKGKFPHLLVSQPGKKAATANSDKLNSVETEINFGTVAVASSASQWVELHNLSPVRRAIVDHHR